jgi:quercetin dioxygenase-like cupin family protein
MHVFSLQAEAEFSAEKHVENVLARVEGGDVTVASWDPGQISPHHCHPEVTEIYFCFEGGGIMRTPDMTVDVKPGAFVVHPPGEVHEYENGSERTMLFRVRYGGETFARAFEWRGNDEWEKTPEDIDYFKDNPVG